MQYTASLQCIVPVFMYLVCIVSIYVSSANGCVTPLFHFLSFFFLHLKLIQNKFYIESKLSRDLREELMKLFADHVAEKHVNALIRKCTLSFKGSGVWIFFF